MITRENYEVYIIDFYDGKLNKIQEEELRTFLSLHPDLKEEFELFSGTPVISENIVYADKNSLKKEDNSSAERLIAYFENDLPVSERKKIEAELKSDPVLEKEYEIIKKTRLLPDYTILFENKESLKHTAKVIYFSSAFYKRISVAASVILVALAYFILRPKTKEENMFVDGQKKNEVPSVVSNDKKSDISVHSENKDSVKENKEENDYPIRKNNSVSPEIQFASDSKKNNKVKSDPGKDDIVPQNNIAPENNFANVISDTLKSQPEQMPVANNSENKNVEKKATVIQQMDLAGVFTEEELKELGISNKTSTEKNKAASILDVAAAKLKRFSNSKEIALVKKENYVEDATTYAVNVGKFSVSHTTVK